MITIKENQCLRDIDPEADKELMESRGGCLCFLSPPCSACVNPYTEYELNSVGYTYGKEES